MIVLDSSALIDYLCGFEPQASWVRERLVAARWNVHGPHLLDVEVVGGLRRLVRRGLIAAEQGASVVGAVRDFHVVRYAHVQLLDRMWELRPNVTSGDAAFVALAEALDAPLVTTDTALAHAPGIHAQIVAFQA